MRKFEPLKQLIKTWRVQDIFQGTEPKEEPGDVSSLNAEYDDARGAWIVGQITQYDTDADAKEQETQDVVFTCEKEGFDADQFGDFFLQEPEQEDNPSGELAVSGTQDDLAKKVVRELEDLMDLWGTQTNGKKR